MQGCTRCFKRGLRLLSSLVWFNPGHLGRLIRWLKVFGRRWRFRGQKVPQALHFLSGSAGSATFTCSRFLALTPQHQPSNAPIHFEGFVASSLPCNCAKPGALLSKAHPLAGYQFTERPSVEDTGQCPVWEHWWFPPVSHLSRRPFRGTMAICDQTRDRFDLTRRRTPSHQMGLSGVLLMEVILVAPGNFACKFLRSGFFRFKTLPLVAPGRL